MRVPALCRIALVAAVAAAGATADDPVDETDRLSDQAWAAFDSGRYAEAAEAFERADTLVPSPDSAVNAGLNYLWAGQCDDAWTALRRMLQRSPEIRQDAHVRRVLQTMAREVDAPDWRRCSLAVRLVRAVDLARGMPVEDSAPEADARWFAQLAESHYEAGWCGAAALFYQVSYDGYPIPDVLYNAAMALHCAGQHREAIGAFRGHVEATESLRSSDTVTEALRAATADDEPGGVEVCVRFSRLRRAIAQVSSEPVTEEGEARRVWELGIRQYRGGEYRAAAVSFECCYHLARHVRILLNAARCHQAAGDWRVALATVDRYLEQMESVAADPAVARARAAFDDEPYATAERATVLFDRLDWAIGRIDPRDTEASGESR